MDWTIRDYAHANHNPEVVVNGQPGKAQLELGGKAKQVLDLDASGTKDPDGRPLHSKWWVYQEAGLSGTHGADVQIVNPTSPKAKLVINSPCREPWLPGILPCHGDGVAHIILEVSDEGSPRLTSYRRVIVHVQATRPPGRNKQ